MITLLGLFLSILGVLGLFSPRTPAGHRINKIFVFDILSYFPLYRKYILNSTLALLITIVYLVLIVKDFYTVQTTLFAIFYLMTFVYLMAFLFFRKSFPESKKTLKSSISILLIFVFIISTISILLNHQIDNNKLKKQFDRCKADKDIVLHLAMQEDNIVEFRNRYELEYMIISRLNKLFKYQERYDFSLELSISKFDSTKPYSKLQNEFIELYRNNNYHPNTKKYFEMALKDKRNKKFSLFPTEIKPEFVSASIIQIFPQQFASLAVGVKIIVLDFYLKMLNYLKLIGIYFTLPFIFLLSLFLTKKISTYNNNYNIMYNNRDNYIFVFSTILGLFITILSLF